MTPVPLAANPVANFLLAPLRDFITSARDQIQTTLSRYLFDTVDTSLPGPDHPFTGNVTLQHLNLGVALTADALVVGVILFASVRAVFERTSVRARYSLKVMLPKLLLAVVLMHFSLAFMQMAIDLNNHLGDAFRGLGNELTVGSAPWAASLARADQGDKLFQLVVGVALVVALAILVVAYIVRHALLSVLVVIAPLAGLCTALPETRGYARTWLRLFTVTVFMQAVQMLVLRVATGLAFDHDGGIVEDFYAIATLFLMLKVPGALSTASHLETRAHTVGHHLERALRKVVVPHHAARRSAA